ncbi:MAG TPA: PRC-barrel domain-containing protein [Thermomicrobiales bacterium]|nr:PRC-barrel domain-containing protein [Thermomicrobiales bacterium]
MEQTKRPHSMSTDNTASAASLSESPEQRLLSDVQTGMRVIDAEGKEVGTVSDLRQGEPGAVSDEPAGPPGALSPIDDLLVGWFGADRDIPETIRHRMLHEGFIKIGGTGLLGGATFAMASEIAAVSGDAVRLNMPARDLISV